MSQHAHTLGACNATGCPSKMLSTRDRLRLFECVKRPFLVLNYALVVAVHGGGQSTCHTAVSQQQHISLSRIIKPPLPCERLDRLKPPVNPSRA